MSLFIKGKWITGEGKHRTIYNPATGDVLQNIVEATEHQTKEAIDAARSTFDDTDWSINRKKRIKVLLKVADLLEKDLEEFARLETLNVGKPINESRMDIEDAAVCLRYYANLIAENVEDKMEMPDGSMSKIVNEPIGVCTLILPWNFPLLLGMWKIAPALAAGNTIVFKPSEITPLSMIRFTKILQEAGLPDGVFNLILGDGKSVGDTLTTNSNVDKVSFTGGIETGKEINKVCAQNLKRVSLELGGKSPMIILDDADIDKAVEWVLFGGFLNQGEVCVASSRILVHESIYQPLLEKLEDKIKLIKIGDPMDERTEMGPIISEEHLQKIKYYIELGVKEGAKLIGGNIVDGAGYYMNPAIFSNVEQSMRIVQEEIFGPVITLQSFQNDEEAIVLANGTKYGLAAGIISEDIDRANNIASHIKAGTIWINNYHIPYVEAPWGGFKDSGIGRELGPHGLAAFSEPKHINQNNSLEALEWYKLKGKAEEE